MGVVIGWVIITGSIRNDFDRMYHYGVVHRIKQFAYERVFRDCLYFLRQIKWIDPLTYVLYVNYHTRKISHRQNVLFYGPFRDHNIETYCI